jgi:methyl-accepting chemotaxis protein
MSSGRTGRARLGALGIKTKLTLLLLAVGLVPMAVVGVLAESKASGVLGDNAGASVREVAFNASDKLDRNLFERYGDVQAFAKSDPAKSMDAGQLTTWMDTMMGTYTPIYNLMAVADRNGRIVAVNTVDLDGEKLDSSGIVGRDVSGEAWFKQAIGGKLEDGETMVEDLHKDSLATAVYGDSPQAEAMSFTYPIKDDAGRIVGVWTNRFNWDVARDILSAVQKRAADSGDKTTRLYLLSKSGTFLVGDRAEDTLKRQIGDAPIGKLALEPKASGYSNGTSLDGKNEDAVLGYERSAGFAVYKGVGWSVVAAQHHDEALAAATGLRNSTLIVALLAALLIAAAGVFVATRIKATIVAILARLRSLEKTDATELAGALDVMAEGDLTREVELSTEAIEEPGDDEIGQIATAVNGLRDQLDTSFDSYNRMTVKLRGLVGEVSGSASSISSASQQMASTSEEAGRAVGEIANAIGDVAQGAERQVRGVESVKTAADDAAGAAQSSADQAQQAAEAAEQARLVAAEGVNAAEQATEAMQAVRGSSESVTGAIRELATKSDEIGAIVETITGIAGQTNLLALNAAIEAARAGEQGRGFAVVAEEVRKLAEESQNAAGEIATLIDAIQSETGRAVEVVEDGAQRTADGAEVVDQTRDAFLRIGTAVDDVNERIGQITGAAQQISAETSKMQSEIGEVAAVAEQSSASTEQVSASTQQTSASTQEIAASAQELASTAAKLEELVGQFKVSV